MTSSNSSCSTVGIYQKKLKLLRGHIRNRSADDDVFSQVKSDYSDKGTLFFIFENFFFLIYILFLGSQEILISWSNKCDNYDSTISILVGQNIFKIL